jgi:hypothetical protein
MTVKGSAVRIDQRSPGWALRRRPSMLAAAAVSGLALAIGLMLWSIRWNEPAAPFNGDCEAWDRLASAAVSDLVADRSPAVEQRLGDAVFRLRRARKYCRLDLVGLARLDYEALTDGRYGRR